MQRTFIRQGPWKLVFLKSNKQELYNLQSDLGESSDVAAANPEIVTRLTALLQTTISTGRSTPGAPQKNDAPMSLDVPRAPKKA